MRLFYSRSDNCLSATFAKNSKQSFKSQNSISTANRFQQYTRKKGKHFFALFFGGKRARGHFHIWSRVGGIFHQATRCPYLPLVRFRRIIHFIISRVRYWGSLTGEKARTQPPTNSAQWAKLKTQPDEYASCWNRFLKWCIFVGKNAHIIDKRTRLAGRNRVCYLNINFYVTSCYKTCAVSS